ncbi:DUF4433 domain-containing protein [Nocardioides caricicola]|uniref:DUF4433 domain-containing protein n=1 Tax=Nocardioides caricicola TaxID=634770 RepID=A0ABW0N600_9ACTN
MDLTYLSASGFVARGGQAPAQDGASEWLAWHFTHVDNLPEIVAEGALLPSSEVDPVVNVANRGVKERRATIRVDPDADYPESVVSEHVPFYIAAKSPMLYVVNRGHDDYDGGCDDLVFLGFVLEDLALSDAVWCVSDQNAATSRVAFTRDLETLGTFVDFDLLCQRMWRNTLDDPDRQSRRAAEVLVYAEFPLEMVQVVVAKNERTLETAREAFEGVGGDRQYHVVRELFY